MNYFRVQVIEMRKYLFIIKNQFMISLSYKANFLIGFLSNVLQLFVSLFIWDSIFLNSKISIDYTKSQMFMYIIVSFIIRLIFSSDYIFRLSGLIHNGKLSQQLIKPISLLYEGFSYFIGKKLIVIILFVVSFGFLILLGLIHEIPNLLLFVIFIITNFMMFFYMLSFLSVLGFWLIQMWPLRPVYNAMFAVLGGTLFPLDLLPDRYFLFFTI